MNQDQFAAMQPLLDKIAELAEKQFDSEELRRLVAELGGIVGKQKVASVTVIGRFKTSHSWALQNQQRCECSVSALKLAFRARGIAASLCFSGS